MQRSGRSSPSRTLDSQGVSCNTWYTGRATTSQRTPGNLPSTWNMLLSWYKPFTMPIHTNRGPASASRADAILEGGVMLRASSLSSYPSRVSVPTSSVSLSVSIPNRSHDIPQRSIDSLFRQDPHDDIVATSLRHHQDLPYREGSSHARQMATSFVYHCLVPLFSI